MRAISRRGTILAVALGGLAALAGGPGADDRSAMAQAVVGEPQPKGLKQFINGSRDCAQCHDNAHSKSYSNDELKSMLCRMTEYPTWSSQDKHKNAFLVLTEERGKAMGERLGIDPAKSQACINCHGTVQEEGVETNRFDAKTDGVSCVACHGAYNEWVRAHQTPRKKDWRALTRRQKEEQSGMTDLWNPVTRATKCASCHIGSAGEQKVVTHAMYAAGHPPLPGFETASFSEAQPRHFQYLREKAPDIQRELGVAPQKREQTEMVVVSGIVALRDAMRLYAAQAGGNGLVKEPETHWPDFARFDCYACHHDLQLPSWRQIRGYGGRPPGRPTPPNWPEVLVHLGLLVADPTGAKGLESEYKVKLDAFQQAMSGRPFGDQERSTAAAQAMADWADGVCREMSGMIEDPKRAVVDGPLALQLLRELCRMAAASPLDFDSARQIALAFRTIYAETKAVDPKTVPDKAIDGILGALDKDAHLSLPSAGNQELIEKTLPERLRAVFEFDPGAFQAAFAELARHLPGP
jgi:hypothetical protein